MPEASTSTAAKPRDQRRSRKRELFCSIHLEQLLAGGGRRYFLHLLSAEELSQRGMPAAKAKLLINTGFSVLAPCCIARRRRIGSKAIGTPMMTLFGPS